LDVTRNLMVSCRHLTSSEKYKILRELFRLFLKYAGRACGLK